MSTAFNDGFATSVIDGNSELLDDIQARCLEALGNSPRSRTEGKTSAHI